MNESTNVNEGDTIRAKGIDMIVERVLTNGVVKARNGRRLYVLSANEYRVKSQPDSPGSIVEDIDTLYANYRTLAEEQAVLTKTVDTLRAIAKVRQEGEMSHAISNDELIEFIAKCPGLTTEEKVELNEKRFEQIKRRMAILENGSEVNS